jgi:hypothetical protein
LHQYLGSETFPHGFIVAKGTNLENTSNKQSEYEAARKTPIRRILEETVATLLMGEYERFLDISERVRDGSLSPEQGMEQIKNPEIDFLRFDIDQIKGVQDAEWLSDEVAVNIMKSWMRRQNEILLELRAHLVVTPTIPKERLLEFTRAVRNPSQEPDLVVEDIIYSLATAGGTREPVNPLTEGLISAAASSELQDQSHRLPELFNFKRAPGQPAPYYMSNSTAGQWITISLPPFLKAQVVSYKLKAPPRVEGKKAQGGISSWNLQASDDLKNFQVTLDIQTENKDLQNVDAVAVFPVRSDQKGFYRHFRLTNAGQNHQNNLSIFLAGFDITGKLIICRE